MGISPQDFKTMQERLSGTKRKVEPVYGADGSSARVQHRVVLGIDPSLRGTGYGVIAVQKTSARALTHGTITCPAGWERSRCLAKISQILRDVLKQYQPTACAIEGLFFAQNLQTALVMGEARGAALAAIAEAGLEIFEIAPRKVKQAVVGYGAAQKLAVAKMVQRMLALPEAPAPDAADALALAVAFTQEHGHYSLKPLKKV